MRISFLLFRSQLFRPGGEDPLRLRTRTVFEFHHHANLDVQGGFLSLRAHLTIRHTHTRRTMLMPLNHKKFRHPEQLVFHLVFPYQVLTPNAAGNTPESAGVPSCGSNGFPSASSNSPWRPQLQSIRTQAAERASSAHASLASRSSDSTTPTFSPNDISRLSYSSKRPPSHISPHTYKRTHRVHLTTAWRVQFPTPAQNRN